MELFASFSILEICKISFHILFGVFWIVQGLNGFFNWFPIPFVSKSMDQFMDQFFKARGLIDAVKLIEILAGFMLLFQFHILIVWILFLPIIFGIITLHWNFNTKPIPMISMMSLFFIGLTLFNWNIISIIFS